MLSLWSCQTVSEQKIVTPSKFGSKVKNLHKTIIIERPGVYDYEGTMHRWRGGGDCGWLGVKVPVMEIRADNVTVKNFGFQDAKEGIVVTDKKPPQTRENVSLENIEGHACNTALKLPERSKGIRVKDSIFVGGP